ncbi:MAG TPA: BON domain-containing protein [Usitatibacter sp.]|jgi:osmotically-inducible protein OsmY|nr:BON domain-containing protein [Usitatibacter sp.]
MTRIHFFRRHLAAIALGALAIPALAARHAGANESAHAGSPSADRVVEGLRDDDALLERVANALANDPELGDSDITVYVGDGRVALQGETRSAIQAVRAVAVTRRAAGSGVEVRSELTSEDLRDAAGA